MIKKLHKNLLLSLVFISVIYNATAQCTTNFLKNPSFELPAQTNIGNNFPVPVSDWTLTSGTANLVKVNGTNYFGGPNNAVSGTQYLDIVNSNGGIEQTFTLTCNSVVTFSGDFSSRESGRNWTAQIVIVNSSNVVVATSATRNFTTADADNNTPPGPDAVWYNLAGVSGTLPPGTYRFRADLDDFGNFDNAFLCATPGCVLPVKLTDFNVLSNNCVPTLQWKSANEVNLKQFEIERSDDGITFLKVGTVPATGNFNGGIYKFNDNTQLNKISFYRLRMMDFDGQFKNSAVLKFDKNCGTDNSFSVYPNPVNDILHFSNYNSTNTDVIVKISSTTGKFIKQVIVKTGTSTIDVSTLAKGVYFVTFISNENAKTIKVIKN